MICKTTLTTTSPNFPKSSSNRSNGLMFNISKITSRGFFSKSFIKSKISHIGNISHRGGSNLPICNKSNNSSIVNIPLEDSTSKTESNSSKTSNPSKSTINSINSPKGIFVKSESQTPHSTEISAEFSLYLKTSF